MLFPTILILGQLLPPGTTLEARVDPDLDGNGTPDVVLIARDAATPPHRTLIAAVSTPRGFRTIATDPRIIPVQEDNSDDPLVGLEAAPRGFRLKLRSFAYLGTWWTSSVTLTFRAEGTCLRLIGYDSVNLLRSTGETDTRSFNLRTGENETSHAVTFDAKPTFATERLAPRRLCLEQLGSGLELSP